MEKQKKQYKITRNITWKDFPPAELAQLQNDLGLKKSLTIAECAIWLGISCSGVSRLIKKGILSAYHPFGAQAVRIDVEASKPLLDQFKKETACASLVHQEAKIDE